VPAAINSVKHYTNDLTISIFSLPLLMTNRLRKTLCEAVYVKFVLKPVCVIWDNSQHEPLGIFISFSLIRHEPWRLREAHPVVDLAHTLRQVPEDDYVQKGNSLRESLCLARQLETIPESVVRDCCVPLKGWHFMVRLPKDEEGKSLVNKEDKLCFMVARPGDHLFCPFQFELFHFRNIQGRTTMVGTGLLDDTELMKCLRRVNMDAFWSRAYDGVT
jgi:hypothetical protein